MSPSADTTANTTATLPMTTLPIPVTAIAKATAKVKVMVDDSKEEKEASTNINSNSSSSSNVHVSSHPVLYHKITILRSSSTPPGTFRSILRQVTYHLGYEATQSLTVKSKLPVTVPLGKEVSREHEELRSSLDCGFKLLDRVALIPILRSGLGMTEAMLELLPNSAVHHIGMYRTPGVHKAPVQYFNRLPRGKCQSDVAYVLDPMVGSAATVMAVISILKKWGVPKIHVITVLASKKGLEVLTSVHPEVSVTVGIIDATLTEDGIVLPGMGDVGDRLFGTGNHQDQDEDEVAQVQVQDQNNHEHEHEQHVGTTNKNENETAAAGTTTTISGATSSSITSSSVDENNDEQFIHKRKRTASLELEMDSSK